MTAASCKIVRDCRGVISVELAIIASLILLPMTLGAMDAAALVSARSRLDQVLHQAFFYAYANGGKVSTADVQSNATTGYGSGTTPTVLATLTQYCITPATGYPPTGTPAVAVNGSCSSGSQTAETYLAVTASVSVTLPFGVKWIARAVTLSASGKARVA